MRIDYGSGNEIRSNIFTGFPNNLIMLVESGNLGLPAPIVEAADNCSVSGLTCANGRVELYVMEKTQVIPLGFVYSDKNGKFTCLSSQPLAGKQVVLLVTDTSGNTSAFSQPNLVN